MEVNMKHFAILLFLLVTPFSFAIKAEENNNNVKYKEAGRIDFESLLIEGERKKPELTVVTGNVGEKDGGLVIQRENFEDMMANDFGENIE